MKNFLYQIWCKKVLAKCNLRLPEFTLVRVGMRWSLYVNVTVAATGRNERKKNALYECRLLRERETAKQQSDGDRQKTNTGILSDNAF